MLRIGSMNMLLHGIEIPDIRYSQYRSNTPQKVPIEISPVRAVATAPGAVASSAKEASKR